MSAIDVGSAATDRTTYGTTDTWIDLANPANASGILTSVEVWATTNITGFRIGSFYNVAGVTFACRDSVYIGNVTSGSKQTFNVWVEIQTGDYIGCYFATGSLEADGAGGSGVYYYSGESIDPGDSNDYTLAAGAAISLYGIGITDFSVGGRVGFQSDPFDVPQIWESVSHNLMGIATRRGRQYEMNRMEAGTAVVQLLNTDGDYWSTNTTGAYYPNILPYKQINLRASYGGTIYDVYSGFIESYQPSFLLKPVKGAVMKITCVDMIKSLSRLKLNDATGFSSELSGTRIANVLDAAGWPTTTRNIQVGQSSLQSTGALVNINALSHIYNVVDSERGIFYSSPSGDATFKDRYDRILNESTSAATFSDTSSDSGFAELRSIYSDKFIYNDIRLTINGGTEQVATSTTSQDAYGIRTYQKADLLLTTDTEAAAQASYLRNQYEDPELRVEQITLKPSNNPATIYPQVLGFGISERITVKLSEASLNKDYHIEGIRHDWQATQPQMWRTTWDLSITDNQIYWVLEDAINGVLDSTTRLCY